MYGILEIKDFKDDEFFWRLILLKSGSFEVGYFGDVFFWIFSFMFWSSLRFGQFGRLGSSKSKISRMTCLVFMGCKKTRHP